MKSLETEYKGYRFRSRLEARWAVFMDAMNVPYQYEREGYDLDGLFYLPDFWLPQMKAHLEIKGEPSPETWKKAGLLAIHTNCPVYVICSQPECPDIDSKWYENESSAELILPAKEDGWERGDSHYLWCECPHCHRCELQFDGRADRIHCDCPTSQHCDKGYNFDSPRLQAAYEKARRYRFEEKPVDYESKFNKLDELFLQVLDIAKRGEKIGRTAIEALLAIENEAVLKYFKRNPSDIAKEILNEFRKGKIDYKVSYLTERSQQHGNNDTSTGAKAGA